MDLLKNPLLNPYANSASREAESSEITKPSETLIEWTAPERLFKTRTREFYRKIATIIIFFMLLLIVIKEFLLIIVLGIVFFVVYVFHTVPPRDVKHQVTTNGINYASEHLYRWGELKSFFITEKEGIRILNLDTVNNLPGRVFLLLSKSVDVKKLTETVNQYVSIVENPEVGILDKMMDGINRRVKI